VATTGSPLPERVGRYRVLGELGTGGMGFLYLARAEGPGGFERLLAIKMLLPHLCRNKSFVDMFLDEARITAMIHHPNVVQTFEVGEHEGQYFLAMDYVSGETLASMLTHTWKVGRPFPRDLGAYVIMCAAEGLHAAHELRDMDGRAKSVVHRDVSPQNVLIGYDGIVRVVDFGIAKAADRLSHTGTGVRKGKAAYMSPEQIRTEAVDRRADVFALGICLWETTVGKRLFKAHNDFATIDRVMRKVIPSPKRFHPDFPAELEHILFKALERDVERRYQSARAMADDLRAFLASRANLVGPTALAGLMDAVFPERKQARTELINKAALEHPPVIDPIPTEEVSASLSRAHSDDGDDYLEIDRDNFDATELSPEPRVSTFDSMYREPKRSIDPVAALGVTFGVLGMAIALAVVVWFGREDPVAEPLYLANPPEEPAAVVVPSAAVEPPPVEPPPVEPPAVAEPVVEKRSKPVVRRTPKKHRFKEKKQVKKARPERNDLFGADEL
jgi:serine/threonine-protein kinase